MEINSKLTQEPNELPPIDKSGIPTTYLSYMLLEYMYNNRNESNTSLKLSNLLGARHSDIELLFSQLRNLDFIIEDSSDHEKFKYNLNCKNVELQMASERFLVEVYLESLPVHLMLDYSPSYKHKYKPRGEK